MTTERVISHYIMIKSPHLMSLKEDNMNARLYVSLNGFGTACYDPHPAVAEFLRTKETRYRELDTTNTNKEISFRSSSETPAHCETNISNV